MISSSGPPANGPATSATAASEAGEAARPRRSSPAPLQGAEDGGDQRGLGVGVVDASGAELAAGGVDERQQHRQMPGGGDVGAELPSAWPRSMSGSRAASTDAWRRRRSSCAVRAGC